MEPAPDSPNVEIGPQGTPPTSQDVARRLIILKYVAVRAIASPPRDILETWLATWDKEAREEFAQYADEEREGFWGGLQEQDLWEYLSPWERQYASSTIVTMPHDDQVIGSWRVECVQTLMWALGLLPALPPYDEMASHDILAEIPPVDTPDFIVSASLRPGAEIEHARGTAELWHWRSRTRQLVESGEEMPCDDRLRAAGLDSFDKVVRFSARRAEAEGIIPSCIEDDFPGFDKAYRDLSNEEWVEMRSISVERHFTLNWLCGYAPQNRWDETPTDT